MSAESFLSPPKQSYEIKSLIKVFAGNRKDVAIEGTSSASRKDLVTGFQGIPRNALYHRHIVINQTNK